MQLLTGKKKRMTWFVMQLLTAKKKRRTYILMYALLCVEIKKTKTKEKNVSSQIR